MLYMSEGDAAVERAFGVSADIDFGEEVREFGEGKVDEAFSLAGVDSELLAKLWGPFVGVSRPLSIPFMLGIPDISHL